MRLFDNKPKKRNIEIEIIPDSDSGNPMQFLEKYLESMNEISSPPLNKMKSMFNNKDVYDVDNHIYFNTHVSDESIQKLSEIIYDMNFKYNKLTSEITTAYLTPKPIYLHLTTHGGSLMAGFKAIDLIENSKIPIYTVAEGYVISAGTLMFMAGKQRLMAKNASILIHQLSDEAGGTYESIKDSFENSTKFMNKLYEFYNIKTNGKLKKSVLKDIMKRDIFWDYEQCKKSGITDDMYVA